MDNQLLFEDFKALLLDSIVTRREDLVLQLLNYNNYQKEESYLDFKKQVSHYLIQFGLPSMIEEFYKQKIFTLKLKIEKRITSVDFAFLNGNVHMLSFILSKGVSLHKEKNDYYYLDLLASNIFKGAECYQFLTKNGYLTVSENLDNKPYSFLDKVIASGNIRLLATALEDGKFKTQWDIDEVRKKLRFQDNSPYTQKSLDIMRINLEKEQLEKSLITTQHKKLNKKI